MDMDDPDKVFGLEELTAARRLGWLEGAGFVAGVVIVAMVISLCLFIFGG